MKRRDALELVVIAAAAPAAAAQEHQHGSAAAAKPAALRALSPSRFDLVDALAEMIIPADKHSPGAREAGVAAFIDDLLADSSESTRAEWTRGLDAVDAEARARHRKPFLELSAAQRDGILRSMAEGEMSPKTDLHRFFVRIKAQTMSGYYSSSVGLLKDLQYKGNVPLATYPGCDHPDHAAGRPARND